MFSRSHVEGGDGRGGCEIRLDSIEERVDEEEEIDDMARFGREKIGTCKMRRAERGGAMLNVGVRNSYLCLPPSPPFHSKLTSFITATRP